MPVTPGDSRIERRYGATYAARLASIHPNTARAWIPEFRGDESHPADSILASFLDLIELRIMRQLREEYHIAPATMALMHQEAQHRAKNQHPFASQRILAERRRIWLDVSGAIIDLGRDGQTGLRPVVDHVADEIEWDRAGWALRWRPSLGVLVDPAIRWGEPVIENTRVLTAAVFSAWKARHRDAQAVADQFAISLQQVDDAVAFESRLAS
jgi:uncharacterized protein (DUF433 family)